jgi:hypothetical protein
MAPATDELRRATKVLNVKMQFWPAGKATFRLRSPPLRLLRSTRYSSREV